MEKLKQLKVGDYYKKQSPDADIVGKDATLPEIIRALLKYKSCRSVFVVDESNTLCGIVTARNLIRILGKSYASDFEIPRIRMKDSPVFCAISFSHKCFDNKKHAACLSIRMRFVLLL